ncbi:MAG: hypothetical protein CME31_23315 [Gimesia sp.]|nr:hypothetical protein [Gimesia sp.]|tara:strand:- start:1655 stop:2989 length:1335 start_codon:yes stop_codon:yes gene_type:complete
MADKKLNIKVRADGAKRAKKDLKGVDNSVKSLGRSALKAGAAFIGTAGLISGIKKTIALAAQQELAERQLSTALGRTSQALLDQASALQKVSMFGDEAIIGQQAFLASLKFSEEQIKKIIPVAMDLAAATGMSLESAVRNTAKTFSGLAGELGELVPQLRELTAEEMRAGKAVEVMNDLFGGQAAGQQGTIAFNMKQLEMAAGDLGEKIGEEFFAKKVGQAADAMVRLSESLSSEDFKKARKGFRQWLDNVNPGLAKTIETVNKMDEERRKNRDKEAPFFSDDFGRPDKRLARNRKKDLEIRFQEFELMKLQVVPVVEMSNAYQKAQEWSAQTATSMMTSALMGDSITDSLKRAVIQLMIMVAQAKAYDYFMTSASGGLNKVGSGIVNFLFGRSPTQASPSAKAGANITINQTIQGGMIDHNFAANSIIPAINKAISTGQARIG